MIATEWPAYRDLDWAALRATMRCPLIIDGRRLLPEAELRALGYVVERLGDGVDSPEARAGVRAQGQPDRTSRER